jgi:pimeloyl-ACP methyl ester carboxylesterase
MADTNIVLVHGGFSDGSVWRGVYDVLKSRGYGVSIVQNPTRTLEEDVAATQLILDGLEGPVILVGHSYGGVVITEAGNDPNVVGLVYVAAFAPDEGESMRMLLESGPAGARVAPLLPPRNGLLFLDKAKFHEAYTHDLDRRESEYLADAQAPSGAALLDALVRRPAWKNKPSWYLIASHDSMIPPEVQRTMARRAGSVTIEVEASHAVHISQPRAVAAVIESAANARAQAAA